jgi:hypothetical protein
MQLERGNFILRLWARLLLLWTNPFHRSHSSIGRRYLLPVGWRSAPKPTWPAVKVEGLERVIPIAQTETAAGILVTLFSLEAYENGFLVHGDISEKYGAWSSENFWVAQPTFVVTDDVGTDYRWWPANGDHTRFTNGFAPELNPNAHELRLTVTHIQWTFFKTHRHVLDKGPWTFRISLE